jgi:signal transduction histidine kinase
MVIVDKQFGTPVHMVKPLNKPTWDQLRELTARQQSLFDQERKRLARRMHDDLSQKATVLAFELSLLSMDMENKQQARPWRKKVKHLCALINELGVSIRSITNQLHPKVLEEFGLVAALECLAKAQQIPCSFSSPVEEVLLPPSVSAGVYGVVESILNNIFLPAQCARVEISFVHVKGRAQLRVCGERLRSNLAQTPEDRLDWLALEERIESLGGAIKLSSVRGVGGIVTIVLPETPSCEAAPF